MCIDAPESTTNSLSSGLRFDAAGKHQFSEGRRMLLCLSPLILELFWPASTLLHGHTALAILSLSSWDRSSNFGALGLRWWGSPGQIIPSDWFWSRMSEWRAAAFANWTHRIGFRMLELFQNRWRLRRLQILKYAFQLSCIWWVSIQNRSPCSVMLLIPLQHSHCTFVTILFRHFARLLFNLAMRIRALFTKSASILRLVEQAFWRMPFFTEWIGASSFEVILAGQSRHSSTGTLASGTSGSRRTSLILPRRRVRRRIRLCCSCTLIDIVTETATVSFRTLPVGFPLSTISWSSLFTRFCPLILDHGVCLIIPVSGLKILNS